MNYSKTQSGFTLVETLVAITILMVAIAGPLNIAEKGLTVAANSRNQTIASFLAEDLTEYIQNMRDDNVLAGGSTQWLAMPSGSEVCATGTPCIAETATGNYSSPSIEQSTCTVSPTTSLNNSCALYIDNTYGYYTYNSSGNRQSPFYRTFTITTPTGLSAVGTNPDSNNIRLLTVRVYWLQGAIQNQVVLQTMIFNTHR